MRRFPVFAITFAAVFSVIYCFALHYGWALFSYGPATGEFMWFSRPATSGPSMHWYGLVVTSGIIAALAALIVSFLPADPGKRPWKDIAWLLPLGSMIAVAFLIVVAGD
ncbi:MAG: hypothetical protein ACHQAY_17215 [Hyphomicrobiales bacterium]